MCNSGLGGKVALHRSSGGNRHHGTNAVTDRKQTNKHQVCIVPVPLSYIDILPSIFSSSVSEVFCT